MHLKSQKVAIVTGSSGFLGFHVSQRLIDEGWRVIGIDSLSDYYDVSLKLKRQSILLQNSCFEIINEKIENPGVLENMFQAERPNLVIHLAAQAGVRYSLQNPREYMDSNIRGTFELLEAAKKQPPQHLLLASTSSVYGDNDKLPYCETDKADNQVSFYASTKKASESIAHSYAHLFQLPITMFRFFTVYGSWGRPDMAYYDFTKKILEDDEIQIFNHGRLERDFTYVGDLVEAIYRLIPCVPKSAEPVDKCIDSISSNAPFRIVNIGNQKPVALMDFISAIESCLGKTANKNYVSMQPGDVHRTWADTRLLQELTGFTPKTDLETGINEFVKWYLHYHDLCKEN